MLKGTLDDFALTDVFRLLASSHRTGRLDVDRPAGSGHVLFSGGRVVYAETSLSPSLLGQKLVGSGALTEAQLRTALDERADSGARLGEIVVSAGLVSEAELEAALREQIQDAVFELLQWETGDFSWRPAESVAAGVDVALDVSELIAEVTRRLEEIEVLREHIPSTGAVPVMASRPPEGTEAVTMSPLEWQTLVLVSGSRNVAEIAEAMGRPEIDTMRTLFSLISAGLIEMRASAAPRTESEPVATPRDGAESGEDAGPSQRDDSAASDSETPDDWFLDPASAVDPMSTGEPADLDVDDVEVSIEEEPRGTGAEEGSQEEQAESVAFPSSDLPTVDRAAAARELSGLSADDSRRTRSAEGPDDGDDENGKGLFSRLMGKQ